MADPKTGQGDPPRHVHIGPEEKKTNWLAWLALLAGILALLFALSRCNRDDEAVAVDNTMTAEAPASAPVAPVSDADVAPAATTVAGVSGAGAYLAGTGSLPRTFAFERLNFDTAKSDIRPQDQAELDSIVSTLKQNANARVRVVGYADARGSDPANAQLGKARADAVKAAMVSGGIDAGRIETASGGETDPVDSNATAQGQAENRRTELVLLSR